MVQAAHVSALQTIVVCKAAYLWKSAWEAFSVGRALPGVMAAQLPGAASTRDSAVHTTSMSHFILLRVSQKTLSDAEGTVLCAG